MENKIARHPSGQEVAPYAGTVCGKKSYRSKAGGTEMCNAAWTHLKKTGFTLLLVLINAQLFSQTNDQKKEVNNISFGMAISPILSEYQPGSTIEFNHFVTKKYFTGLRFLSNRNTVHDTFGFRVEQPVIHFIELGWNNGIQLYGTEKVKISASLSNNVCMVRLGDNSEKTSIITEEGVVTIPKLIETDFIYALVPNLEASFRLYNSMFLSANVKYRQDIGASFAGVNQFNGFLYGIGLTFFLE
jgi:hypothetical protein